MKCNKCDLEMTELEAISEEIISFIEKEDREEGVKFSLNIGGYKIGDKIIHGSIDRAYYCENCGDIIAKINKVDF